MESQFRHFPFGVTCSFWSSDESAVGGRESLNPAAGGLWFGTYSFNTLMPSSRCGSSEEYDDRCWYVLYVEGTLHLILPSLCLCLFPAW